MMYDLILSNSLTYAQQGASILECTGMRAFVVRAPKNISLTGCTYALKVSGGMGGRASSVLRQKHIPHGRIYTVYPSGKIVEVGG